MHPAQLALTSRCKMHADALSEVLADISTNPFMIVFPNKLLFKAVSKASATCVNSVPALGVHRVAVPLLFSRNPFLQLLPSSGSTTGSLASSCCKQQRDPDKIWVRTLARLSVS